MKHILLILLFASTLHAELSKVELNRYVNAIERVENSKLHPFGVMIKTSNPRKVCENTVRNSHRRLVQAGKRGEFIDHLSKRYAPIGVSNDPHNLNRNWKRNLKSILKQQKGK